MDQQKPKTQKKNEDDEELRCELLQDVSEWPQDFKENLVDDPVLLMSYQWSREQKWYRARLSKVSFLTSRRTRIAISAEGQKLQRLLAEDALVKSCPERTVLVIYQPRMTKFSVKDRNRNNHRYAVVVQDLATLWIQSYPCKTRTSQETQKNLMKFLEPTRKPKVIYTDNSLEFGKSCEELSWNHCTSTPHRSETNGIAESAVRRVIEGTSAVLLQSGVDAK